MRGLSISEGMLDEPLEMKDLHDDESVVSEEEWEIKQHYLSHPKRKLVSPMTKQDYLEDFGIKE